MVVPAFITVVAVLWDLSLPLPPPTFRAPAQRLCPDHNPQALLILKILQLRCRGGNRTPLQNNRTRKEHKRKTCNKPCLSHPPGKPKRYQVMLKFARSVPALDLLSAVQLNEPLEFIHRVVLLLCTLQPRETWQLPSRQGGRVGGREGTISGEGTRQRRGGCLNHLEFAPFFMTTILRP